MMKITAVMVATYIIDCCLIGTRPCKYFQINSPFFNEKKGVFSKMDLDNLIADEWKLVQQYDDQSYIPDRYPVFLKPEWGENAMGIFRADNIEQLMQYRQSVKNSSVPYLIQQGATETREFELFALRHYKNRDTFSVLSITEVLNQWEKKPVNGINNPNTVYKDITGMITDNQKQVLWSIPERIGHFGISRLCIRADSVENILQGQFHIIEINLFTPMPIHMLDKKYSISDKTKMVLEYMMKLARLTRNRDKTRIEKPVYIKMMFYNRQGLLANLIQNYL